jgi:hypothetical protein
MTMSKAEPTLAELFEDGRAIDEALLEAARDARRFHKALGNPMATWLDGRVVWCSLKTSASTMSRRRSASRPNELLRLGQRALDRLSISAVAPASESLDDVRAEAWPATIGTSAPKIRVIEFLFGCSMPLNVAACQQLRPGHVARPSRTAWTLAELQ